MDLILGDKYGIGKYVFQSYIIQNILESQNLTDSERLKLHTVVICNYF